MQVPTVNIIMSYDFKDLFEFQKSMTFNDFKHGLGSKKGGTQQTYLFSNNPASNFLSLKHKFGFSQGGKSAAAPELALEFIDPQGMFEDSWFNPMDTADEIPIDDDPLGSQLQREKAKLLGYVTVIDSIKSGEYSSKLDAALEGGGFFTDGATLNQVQAAKAAQEDVIDALEEAYEEGEDGQGGDYGDKNLELIQKQIDANSSQLQRPVWITYGIGDFLNDWTPIICFDRCTKMEYSFTGGGARTLKLVYSGVGIHPNLTQMGIGPLKGFTMGVMFTGESNPVFNKRAFELEKNFYKPLLEEVGSNYEPDVWKPSIHKIIRDCLRRFVKGAIGKNTNVLCILPDLDKYLKPELENQLKIVRASMQAAFHQWQQEDDWENITSNIQATKEVIETCGLNFVEEFNEDVQTAVGANVWDRIESISDPTKVMKWLQTKDLTAIISGDGVTESIQEKISNVMDKIKEAVDDLGTIPDFTPYWYVETDFRMLEVMYKHFGSRDFKIAGITPTGPIYETNSVGEPMKPVVVVGDRNTIMSYLQARIFDSKAPDLKSTASREGVDPARLAKMDARFKKANEAATQEDKLRAAVTDQINPYDQADGLTYDFMREIYDVSIPIPWISPFGGSTGGDSDDQYLPGDTNIPKDDIDQLKKEQPLTASRMPVFALGTKNPNVLSLDIDINKQYYNLMNTIEPSAKGRSAQQYTTAIMGKGSDESQEVTNIFNAIAKLNLKDVDKNGIPKGFEALVTPYWDQNTALWVTTDAWEAAGEIDDLGGVGTLFTQFGTDNDMSELVDPEGKAFTDKEEMVKFMWKGFSAISNVHKPRGRKQSSGKGVAGGKNAITNQAKMMASLASQAMLGTITTIPMFHLSNDRRVVSRKALLYCVEPRFAAGASPFEKATNKIKTNLTWFSGTYIMTGFEHTISKGSVQSSFAINRPPGARE